LLAHRRKHEIEITYSESLQVIDAEVVTEEVEESILKHAAVSVTKAQNGQWMGAGRLLQLTYERTKRSRFNQSGFLGLKFRNLLNRT
jgi:hypothetical protein